MRTAFADELTKLAATDERIILLVGDIGNTLFDAYRAQFPTRFYNCGIAEQNMVSMAAGLAASGFRPVCFTIAPFLTARCFEQIKIDLGYHNVPVVLAGVGAGLCYANLGPTHQALDDIAILRTVPNLKIAVPSGTAQARTALAVCLKEDGPTYLRLGRDGEALGDPRFEFGRPYWTSFNCRTSDAVVLTCGASAHVAALGITEAVTIYDCPSVKPFALPAHDALLIVTVEEHSIVGGFGSAVAEWLADHGSATRLLRIGTPDEFLPSPLSPSEARDYCGLTPAHIAGRIRAELAKLR